MTGFSARSSSPEGLHAPVPPGAWRIAVVGAGPAGLALALHAARALPQAAITVFDARPADRDVRADPRTLALSLGSVLDLRRLDAWPAAQAEPILEVQVSQAEPGWAPPAAPWSAAAETGAAADPATVRLRAEAVGVEMLGAVLRYGALVHRLQQRWEEAVAEAAAAASGGVAVSETPRLTSRFGQPVAEVRALPGGGVEVDAGIVERFDLAVVAEGGVFAEQARKSLARDYGQVAWVGELMLEGATPGRAIERFTRDGPLALLPLPRPAAGGAGFAAGGSAPGADAHRLPAALVWCVPAKDDPVGELDDAQRLAVLNDRLPAAAGRVVALGPLKRFALGLNAERSLVDGAIVRIGNAAQTLHPVAGQGLNLGLRDAAVLVQALQHAGPGGLAAALREMAWRRTPDRWATIAATDLLARGFAWNLPGLGAARGAGLAALEALPWLKRRFASQMMFGWR